MISPKHSLSVEVTKLQRPVSCLYVKNCRPENQWIQRMHDNRHLLATPCAICTGLSTTQASSVVCWVASVVSNSFWPSRLSPPGSSVHGICQARILEWLAMPSSRGSSPPRDRTSISYVFYTGRQVLYCLASQSMEFSRPKYWSG